MLVVNCDVPTQETTRQKVCAILYALETYHKGRAKKLPSSPTHQQSLLKINALLTGQHSDVMTDLFTVWERIRLEKSEADAVGAFMTHLNTVLDTL